MSLNSQLTSDLSIFFDTDDFADTVTYSGSDISAIVEYGEDLDKETGAVVARAMLTVKKSDVSAPAYRDTVVIGSDTWRVENIAEGDGYVWRINLYRDERPVLS